MYAEFDFSGKSFIINAAMPWFIVTFLFMTTLALDESLMLFVFKLILSLCCKIQKFGNRDLHVINERGISPIDLITVSWIQAPKFIKEVLGKYHAVLSRQNMQKHAKSEPPCLHTNTFIFSQFL